MVNKVLVKKLEKLDEISRIKWLSEFPSLTDKVWNGDLQRQEALLIKDIDSYPKKITKASVGGNCNYKVPGILLADYAGSHNKKRAKNFSQLQQQCPSLGCCATSQSPLTPPFVVSSSPIVNDV